MPNKSRRTGTSARSLFPKGCLRRRTNFRKSRSCNECRPGAKAAMLVSGRCFGNIAHVVCSSSESRSSMTVHESPEVPGSQRPASCDHHQQTLDHSAVNIVDWNRPGTL
ncbi:hypothetical protein RRG08_062199 [Elysia crispata]|uniref:Uncharacterized protein n=1 Tax=Elysia crispata TaxID=231223 RepID=A0AAE1CUS8_9GAST|nr:hypothetical protein RRG08_062199 [Elysia crispata]